MRTLACLGLSLLLAACSSDDPFADLPANATTSMRSGSICTPMSYPREIANAAYYRQFGSDAEAAGFVTKLVEAGRLAPVSGDGARFVEISSDARLAKLVADVHEGFRRVFPAAVEGLTAPPRIAVVESDAVNAFALGPGFAEDASQSADRAPWLLFVHTALLRGEHSDGALRGLLAHELGHLVLRNSSPDVQSSLRVTYRVPEKEDGIFGATQKDDPIVIARVEEIRKRRDRIGSYPELGLATTGAYARKLMELVTDAAAASPRAACDDAFSTMDALASAQKALLPPLGVATGVPRPPTADERARLDALARSAEDAIRACTAGLDTPLAKSGVLRVSAELNYLSATAEDPQDRDHAALLAAAPAIEATVDAADPGAPLVDRLFRAEALLRADLLALQQDPALPIDAIRIYDYEEDSDDAAVRVLRTTGDDPASAGAFLVDVIVPADVRASCLADLAAGKTPLFGRFDGPHPGACWRYYHARELAKALDACDAAAR